MCNTELPKKLLNCPNCGDFLSPREQEEGECWSCGWNQDDEPEQPDTTPAQATNSED